MIDHPQPSPFRGAARWIASWLVVSTLTVIITLYVLARVVPPADERPKGEAVVESGAAPSLPSPSPPRQRCVAADHLVGGFAPTVAELDPDQEAAVDGIALAANSATCVSQAADGVGAQSGLDCGDGIRAVVVGHADANPSGRAGGNRGPVARPGPRRDPAPARPRRGGDPDRGSRGDRTRPRSDARRTPTPPATRRRPAGHRPTPLRLAPTGRWRATDGRRPSALRPGGRASSCPRTGSGACNVRLSADRVRRLRRTAVRGPSRAPATSGSPRAGSGACGGRLPGARGPGPGARGRATRPGRRRRRRPCRRWPARGRTGHRARPGARR